jgi:hypothetical protein
VGARGSSGVCRHGDKKRGMLGDGAGRRPESGVRGHNFTVGRFSKYAAVCSFYFPIASVCFEYTCVSSPCP